MNLINKNITQRKLINLTL